MNHSGINSMAYRIRFPTKISLLLGADELHALSLFYSLYKKKLKPSLGNVSTWTVPMYNSRSRDEVINCVSKCHISGLCPDLYIYMYYTCIGLIVTYHYREWCRVKGPFNKFNISKKRKLVAKGGGGVCQPLWQVNHWLGIYCGVPGPPRLSKIVTDRLGFIVCWVRPTVWIREIVHLLNGLKGTGAPWVLSMCWAVSLMETPLPWHATI